jgi:hypothetical protein
MRADIIAEKVIKGIHSQGWRVIGIGGSLTKAMRPLEEYIKRKVERAVKAEREECAKVCDELAALDKLSNYYKVAANAIRARGEK